MAETKVCALLGLGILVGHSAALGADPIDLPTAVRMGVDHSWARRISQSSRDEAEARTVQAYAGVLPRVTAEGTFAWVSDDVNKSVGQNLGTQQVPDKVQRASITVAQPLVGLWVGSRRLAAQEAVEDAAEAEVAGADLQAAFSTGESFINTRKAARLVEIAEASVKAAETQRRSGEVLLSAGKITQADLLRLDAALSEARLQLARLKAQQATALFALREMLGLPQNQEISLSDDNSIDVKAPVPQAVDAAVVERRSELRAADARLQGLESGTSAARSDLLPSLNAFIKYERNFAQEDVRVPPMHMHLPTGAPVGTPARTIPAEDVRDNLTFGFQFQWEIFDGGARLGRIREVAASRQKAMYGREQLAAQLRVEATQAMEELRQFGSALQFAEAALASAEEAYRQQSLRFDNGLANVTDLTSAERDLTRARGNVANARADVELAWLRLWRATGVNPMTRLAAGGAHGG